MGFTVKIPEFKSYAGQYFAVGSLGKNDVRYRIQATMANEVRAYAETLENAGFRKIYGREISAGSAYAYNVNLFYFHEKDGVGVYTFFDASLRTVFITAEPTSVYPTTEKPALSAEDNVPLSVTQMSVTGLGYVAQFADGSFLCVDGGISSPEAEKELYEFLKARAPQGKINVALWLFTHSHDDHVGLATKFLATYKDEVQVEAFAYQFPDVEKIAASENTKAEMCRDITGIEKAMEENYPNAKRYTVHTGQKYFFKGAEMEILYSPDNTYPSYYCSANDLSVALRLHFDGGKNALLLGDCMFRECQQMARTYGDYMKSDCLQVSHHGLIGGDKELYKLIDPQICLWATSEERFSGTKQEPYRWCIGEGECDYNAYLRDESIRKREHYHAGEIKTIYFEKQEQGNG